MNSPSSGRQASGSSKEHQLSVPRLISWLAVTGGLLPPLGGLAVTGGDLAAIVADRAAVELVYYSHRAGNNPTFVNAMPPELIERIVKQDLQKEAVLRQTFGIEVTAAQVTAEAGRIDTSTRAPDVLAELKRALGNDPERFARAVVRPMLVERELRRRFDRDDRFHEPERREMDGVRKELLSSKAAGASPDQILARLRHDRSNQVSETSWELTARPRESSGEPIDPVEIRRRSGANAQLLLSPHDHEGEKLYFEDLPPDLREVLRVQLRQPGDVSATVEAPGSFLLYVAEEKTAQTLKAAILAIPKRSFQEWLADLERNKQ
jgi:hypothetical protein